MMISKVRFLVIIWTPEDLLMVIPGWGINQFSDTKEAGVVEEKLAATK